MYLLLAYVAREFLGSDTTSAGREGLPWSSSPKESMTWERLCAMGEKDPKRCGYVNRKHGWTWVAESLLLGLFWIIPVGCAAMLMGSSLGNVWCLLIYLESGIWRFYCVCLHECSLRASHELKGILKWKSWWLFHRAHRAVRNVVINSPSYLWSYVQPVLKWVKVRIFKEELLKRSMFRTYFFLY